MALLYDEKRETNDVFTYKISDIGVGVNDELIKYKENEVRISFENGRFKEVEYPFRSPYSRRMWDVMKEIVEKIERIEELFFKEVSLHE